MRTARMFVLLVAFGQAACGSGTRVTAPSAEGVSGAKLHEVEPSLPTGLVCLDHPMLHYWYVSSSFRDPKHRFAPGNHSGVDFPSPVGTAVLASADGEVVEVEPVAPGKNAFVSVRFGDGWTYAVHHLSRVDVEKGEIVARGDTLGLSGGEVDADGSGPLTTGPHLHFSVAHDDVSVNPAPRFCP